MGKERGRARARPRLRSVFGCEHDGEHAHGLRRITRIFAALRQCAVVIVDLPEGALTRMLDRAEIALAVRVVVRREAAEGSDFLGPAEAPSKGHFLF